MPAVCFYFQVHQPYRVKKYRLFDVGYDHSYFNDESESNLNNRKIMKKVAEKCYLPANEVMLHLLKKYPEFRLAYSLSGVFLEAALTYTPEVIDSFKRLVQTGRVEILDETYHHSLSFLYSKREFEDQVLQHRFLIQKLFNFTPTVFRNTELIYMNEVADVVSKMGYLGILAEGADHILEWRSPNFLYRAPDSLLALLLKNYKLSDDIAFRFSTPSWTEYPLTAPKFAQWISAINGSGDLVNLFMDYETFGEHQWQETGIFDFLRALPEEILKNPDNSFVLPSEAIARFSSKAVLHVPHPVSWADIERDLSAWRSNAMQHEALAKVYSFRDKVIRSKDAQLIEDWRRLQTSDHFYYMCTKWFADGDIHMYFNPYESPYEAFIAYMNVLRDFELRLTDQIRRKGTRAQSHMVK